MNNKRFTSVLLGLLFLSTSRFLSNVEASEKSQNLPLLREVIFEDTERKKTLVYASASEQANLHFDRGLSYQKAGEWELTLEEYNQALKINSNLAEVQTAQDKIEEANRLYNQVLNDRRENNISQQEALPLLHRALKIYEEEDVRQIDETRRRERELLELLGGMYASLEKSDQAIYYYQQVLLLYKFQSDEDRDLLARAGMNPEASTLRSLGEIYQLSKQYQKAIDYYQQALLKFESDVAYDRIMILMNLGNVYQILEQHQKAIDNFQQILLAYESHNEKKDDIIIKGKRHNFSGRDHSIDAKALYNMGFSLGALRQYQESIDYLKQSRSIFQSLSDRYKAIEYFQQKFPESTLNSYKDVPELYNEKFYKNNNYLEASSLYFIGLNYKTLYKIKTIEGVNNDTLNWKEKAISSYEQALVIFQSLEHQEMEAKVQQALQDLKLE